MIESPITIPEDEKYYQCEILCDSLNIDTGSRLTTWRVKYPLMVQQDFLRHRAGSRCVASNRGIPIKNILAMVKQDTVEPLRWGKNKPGMQADSDTLEYKEALTAKRYWGLARRMACYVTQELARLGLHKQWTNRILTAFQWVTEVISFTDVCNLFALRYHEDTQPELCKIVEMMADALVISTPQHLKPGQWHIPFDPMFEDPSLVIRDRLIISASRCARTSYRTHAGKLSTPEEDKKLYHEKLMSNHIIHASPTEHQAMAMPSHKIFEPDWSKIDMDAYIDHRIDKDSYRAATTMPIPGEYREKYYGNFQGFLQFRMLHPNQCIREFDYKGHHLSDG